MIMILILILILIMIMIMIMIMIIIIIVIMIFRQVCSAHQRDFQGGHAKIGVERWGRE